MYEMAKSAREALKSKARRLAGESEGKVDATSVKRPSAFTAAGKTGLQPTTKRAYKKGGRVGKDNGGSLPSPQEAMESEARQKSIRVEDKRSLPAASEAAARSGKTPQDVPGQKKGGKVAKRVGRKNGGVTVINIGKGQNEGQAPAMPRPVPVPMPAAAPPPMNSQMPVMQPPQPPAPGAQKPPLALKKGGRAVKVAKSYKDMRAGAGSGEGRLQKTDIAKKRA